ncbi:MAG: hypothetical protein L7F78_27655, partial [Syntrophales bacterium LBB04]|nr:hypothetical protein [Syntrophales bacterium LBB04]
MHLNKLLINITLFLLFLFLSSAALDEWKGAKEAVPKPNMVAKSPVVSASKAEARRISNENEYRDIVERNLFSPNRVEFIPNAVTPGPSREVDLQPVTSTKFTLYGIIIMD